MVDRKKRVFEMCDSYKIPKAQMLFLYVGMYCMYTALPVYIYIHTQKWFIVIYLNRNGKLMNASVCLYSCWCIGACLCSCT